MQVVTLLVACASSVVALTCDKFDLRQELLLAVKSCLGSRLLLLHLLLYFHVAVSSGTGRLERITTALGQVLSQHLLRLLVI